MTRRLALAITVLALGACAKNVQSRTTPVAPAIHSQVCGDAELRSLCAPAHEVAPTQEAVRPVRVDTNLRSPNALNTTAA